MSTKKEELEKGLTKAKAKLDKTRADEESSTGDRLQAEADYSRLTNLARHIGQPTFDAKYDKVAELHPGLLKKASKPKSKPDPDPEPPANTEPETPED